MYEKWEEMIKRFIGDETGAVTIDWVILTAGMVVMSIAAMSFFTVDKDASAAVVCINGKPKVLVTEGSALTKIVVGTRERMRSYTGLLSGDGGC